jgi:cytochrome P450
MFLLVKVLLSAIFLAYTPSLYSLYRNYQAARKVGLPIFLTPIDKFKPFWAIFGPTLIFPILHKAPFQFISDWALFGDFGWPVPDRGRIHQRWGPAFLVVSPGSVHLVTDDPAATEDVLRRTNAFVKPSIIYENIEYFGPNVDTVNGEAWQRHRRLTTPPFNERNSGLVWRESLKQAEGMIARWTKEELSAEELGQDTMKLALHVLTSAGFGKAYDFNAGTSEISKGHTMSYKDALAGILKDMRMAIIAHKVNGPPEWILPKSLLFMKKCMAEFKQYMVESAEEQRLNMDSKTNMQQDNLMSALVRANEISRTEGKERYSLSDDEIYGNLFIWNLAGHDTTATTLAFAFTVLSVNREVQDWIAEEVNAVVGNTPFEEWDYEALFPQLKRCLATMVCIHSLF